MCIVVDINTLALVFSPESKKHAEFSPVKKWVEEGRGFVVYGGTSYKAELGGRLCIVRRWAAVRRGTETQGCPGQPGRDSAAFSSLCGTSVRYTNGKTRYLTRRPAH